MGRKNTKSSSTHHHRPLAAEALHRLEEKKRQQEGEEPLSGIGGSGVLLSYSDPKQEDSFMHFIHTTPLVAALLVHTTIAVMLIIRAFIFEVTQTAAVITVIGTGLALLEIAIHVASRKVSEVRLYQLLKVERVCTTVTLTVVAFGAVSTSYQVMNDCSKLSWSPVGKQPKAYSEGYCNYWNGFITIVFGILVVLRVINFKVLLGTSALTMLLAATLWMAPGYEPQADTTALVTRGVLITFAGCMLVCVIRYIDEKQQRRYFEAQEALMQSAELLSSKRVATLERFFLVLPLAVSDRLREGRWKSSHVDVASDATVLVTRVYDFVNLSKSMLPLQVAALVGAMQTEVDFVLRKWRLERVGRLGDTTVAVGNLLGRSNRNMAAVTLEAGRRVAMLGADAMSSRVLPLVSAVHMGDVEGVLQGTHYVRYEVRGHAVDVTRSAIQLCEKENRLVASSTITEVASVDDDSTRWFDDDELLSIDIRGGQPVIFRRTKGEMQILGSQEVSAADDPSFIAHSIAGVDDLKFVACALRLLGEGDLMTSTAGMTTLNESASADHSSAGSPSASSAPLEIITDKFGFYKFADPEEESRFCEQRIEELMNHAAKVWLGYAAFVAIILLVLISEMSGPFAIIGAIMLVVAVLSSVALAVVPSFVTAERLARIQRVWTGVGIIVPVLTILGCALSRPSMVGLDLRMYIAFGAFMRSYCLTDARMQAVGVPLFALFSFLHYFLPGASDSFNTMPVLWILIFSTVIAGRNREGSARSDYRRKMQAAAVVKQIEEVSRVQSGLLRSSMPKAVFDAARATDFRGPRQVFEANAVVMVIRAARHATTDCSSKLEQVLDVVMATTHLATAGVLGDDAVVVGPVPTSEKRVSNDRKVGVHEEALSEALGLGLAVTQSSYSARAPAQSVLLDQDAVAHVMDLGSRPSYSLLGVSASRLISIGADVSGMVQGLLVTDRVTAVMKAAEMLDDLVSEVQAPMTVRGQGVLRWTKVWR